MRWHRAKRSRYRDDVCLEVRTQLRLQGHFIEAAPRHRMKMTVVRSGRRLLDFGNLVGGFKLILDALVLERLIRDDSPAWLDDTYRQEQVNDDPSTLIVLAPARARR